MFFLLDLGVPDVELPEVVDVQNVDHQAQIEGVECGPLQDFVALLGGEHLNHVGYDDEQKDDRFTDDAHQNLQVIKIDRTDQPNGCKTKEQSVENEAHEENHEVLEENPAGTQHHIRHEEEDQDVPVSESGFGNRGQLLFGEFFHAFRKPQQIEVYAILRLRGD